MKILIALDQSECSDMAIKSVFNRNWPETAEFRLISIFEPVANMCVGWHAAYVPVVMIEAEQTMLSDRKKYIEKKVDETKAHFPKNTVSGKVIDGYAWHAIVDEAKNWNADLIIVGSHGRSGFSRLFLGSVAEAVASHASCSVEIIKGHPLTDAEVA